MIKEVLKGITFYLGVFLILLILVFIFRKFFGRLFKKIFKKKNFKNKTKFKEEKVKSKKIYFYDFSSHLFFIVGFSILLFGFLNNFSFFVSGFEIMNGFLLGFIGSQIWVTLILAIFLSVLFVVISNILEKVWKKSSFGGFIFFFVFSLLSAMLILVFSEFIRNGIFDWVNSIIFGAIFILIGFFSNINKFLKKDFVD